MRGEWLKYQDGGSSILRCPIPGASKKVATPEGLQYDCSIQWRKRCGERGWSEDDRLPGLEGNNSIERRNAADGEVPREMFRNVVPPGGTGEPVHNRDSAEVEKDGRNACRFCKRVRRAVIPNLIKANLPCVLMMIRIPV